jgi:hypothetical protein
VAEEDHLELQVIFRHVMALRNRPTSGMLVVPAVGIREIYLAGIMARGRRNANATSSRKDVAVVEANGDACEVNDPAEQMFCLVGSLAVEFFGAR